MLHTYSYGNSVRLSRTCFVEKRNRVLSICHNHMKEECFCSAAALQGNASAVIATANPSVCLSVTLRYPIQRNAQSDPPPLKSADFDQYLLIMSQP